MRIFRPRAICRSAQAMGSRRHSRCEEPTGKLLDGKYCCWCGRYVEEIRTTLGICEGGRIEQQEADRYILKEEPEPYNAVFGPKTEGLSPENGYYWDYCSINSMCWLGSTPEIEVKGSKLFQLGPTPAIPHKTSFNPCNKSALIYTTVLLACQPWDKI